MFNLKRLFTTNRETGNQFDNSTEFPPAIELQYNDAFIRPETIDQVFYGKLLGVNSVIEQELNPFESNVLKLLNNLLKQDLRSSNLLPRLPAILPKIMSSLRDENSTAIDIARLIENDPVLVADVMRLVNSPFYMTRNKIATLQQATLMLGRDGLRKLVAGAIMKPLLNQKNGYFSTMASPSLWEHSGKTALAASVINSGSEEDLFHAYLAGILHNIGYTLSFKLMDSVFDANHSPNSKEFHIRFVELSQNLTQRIAQAWTMPQPVCAALNTQQAIASDNLSHALARNHYIADKLAKTAIVSEKLAISPQQTNILVNQKICGECRYAFDNISFKPD